MFITNKRSIEVIGLIILLNVLITTKLYKYGGIA